MSDETTPSLREQIVSRLMEAWPWGIRLNAEGNADKLREIGDVVMALVQPELDRRDAEHRRLRTLVDKAQQTLPIEQRRLLSISRMVFDHIAEGRPIITRDEAADLAQRIVDEIGHSVTEEPALGPTFRVEIDQLKATLARVRELALMGGQDPVQIRQWIVIEIDQQPPLAEAAPDPGDGDAQNITISRAALLGLFSCAFIGEDFLMTHGQLCEITAALGDDAVIPRRSDLDQPADHTTEPTR